MRYLLVGLRVVLLDVVIAAGSLVFADAKLGPHIGVGFSNLRDYYTFSLNP